MKTKFLTGLAVAAMLLTGQPVFAATHKGGGHPTAHAHAAVAVHRSVSHTRVAAVHNRVTRNTAIASRRSFAAPASRGYTANISHARNGARNSMALAGNTNYARGNTTYGHGNNHGTYAFASHSGWNHGQQYFWHGHHYGWYGGGWYIIDAYPYEWNTGYDYSSGAPVSVQVQAALQQQGYYEGQIDGVVGPGTSAAIAAFQQANGLPVTGTITRGLMAELGVG
jgi:hypothetical protein